MLLVIACVIYKATDQKKKWMHQFTCCDHSFYVLI